MLTSWLLVTVALVVIAILVLSHRRKENYPPGPIPWPIIGNQSFLRRLSREHGGLHLAYLQISKRYRSDVIALRLGTKDVVVVSGNKHIHAILNSQDYDGRPWNEFIKLRNMGMKKGITMNDGPEWKELRSWLLRTFRTVGFGQRAMSDLIKEELVVVLESMKKGGVQRMKPLIAPTVINVLWTLASGKRFCDGSRLQYFMGLMERRSRVFDISGGLLSTFPWIRYIAPEASGYNILMTLNNELKTFMLESIWEHQKKYVPGGEIDLIDMFLREMSMVKDRKTVFTEEQLVMILVDLFIAGISTTTATLDFLFMHMAVHQDVQRRLQEEIDSAIPSDRLPDLDDRPKLPYTEAVLTESQRMWVVTPIIGPRRADQDMTLGDYKIPKNTDILINLYSIHMDSNLFSDPHAFKPERHIKNGAYEPNENVLGFGKGHRRCPGEILAKSALFLLLTGVMQRYRILPVPGKGPTEVNYVPGLTISPKDYEVLIVPRQIE